MVWDWRVSRAGPMPLYWPKLLYPFFTSTLFPFLFFLSIFWYCGAVVFGLIGCISLSQWRLMICIAIDNDSNNTVGGSCYSAHQDVKKFVKHHIDMVCCVHRKCQTRAGVSRDIIKSFDSVTITDSKFSNRVLVRMTPKSTSINYVTTWLEQFDFWLHRCKWELPNQHIPNCILPPELFFNILIISTVVVMTCHR